ncbi:MAG: ribosome biogenesis GTPase Der, partial [Anaerolineaceae bacterium]|nr:ribosome biogenesis GTPase Der [Anaerolineaceae bacterium]
MAKPVVALVGRPNVGKSTLFNRLTGERLAIVDDIPGTTRDRLLSEAEWTGHYFYVMDTGGIDPSKNRNQAPLSIGSKDFITQIKDQAELAMQESDLILFIVDGQVGVTPADHEIADILRRKQRNVDGKRMPPILLVVNKCESAKIRQIIAEFYELGMGDPYAISALHGTGSGDLLDAIVANFTDSVNDEDEDDSVKIAIVGKPNAGKSSLLNKIVGEERAIVSEIPGTTRDAVDTKIDSDGLPITLIDTAGIRRRGKVAPGVEKYSVVRSMKAIERADVAILVIDASTSITAQDTHIAGYIKDAWKSAIVVVNKWDLIEKDTYTINDFSTQIRQELNFVDYVPLVFISALTGKR